MQNIDRPNHRMRNAIDAALRQMDDLRKQVAAALNREGVPTAVIARILSDPPHRRRPIAPS